MTDDDLLYGDFPKPDDDDFRQEPPADPFEDHARETIVSDPFEELGLDDLDDRARETVVTDALNEQDDHFRADFDERLGRVRARRARNLHQQGTRPRRRLITPGCVALVMGFSTVTLALAVLAMFLPPFAEANPVIEALEDSGSGHVKLDSTDRSTERDGLRVEVMPGDPGQNLSVAIQGVAADDVAENCQPAESLPRFGTVIGSVYSLDFTGSLPQRIGLSLPLPDDAASEQVNLYAWYAEAARWQFVPSQKSPELNRLLTDLPAAPECIAALQVMPPIPVLAANLDLGQALDPEIASHINRLYVTGMRPTSQGTLQGLLPADLPENPDFSVLPLISNANGSGAVDVNSVRAILGNPESRVSHSANIAAFAESGAYAGVVIDYREVTPEQRHQFSDFVQNLARALQDRLLVIVVPPAQLDDSGWTGGGYDWRTLGLFADEIVIRAPLDPRAYAPNGEVENMLRWAVGEVDRYKLALGLSTHSLEVVPGGVQRLVAADAAWQALRGIRVEEDTSELRLVLDSPYEAALNLDAMSKTPFIRYGGEDAVLRTFWLTTGNALYHRMQMTANFNMAGIVLFDAHAGDTNANLPDLLRAYQDGSPPNEPSLSLRWRVYDAEGALIAEELASPGAPVTYPLTGAESSLTFEAALIGDIVQFIGSSEYVVGAAAPADSAAEQAVEETPAPTTEVVQAATLTPTPTPSPEPTLPPEPTATPTIVPTINAAEVEGTLPADFEIGAHITGDYQDEKWDWMRVAGMTWVKVQLRYEPGMDANDYGWQIQLIHENGFKVLWGVVGEKDEVLSPGYFEEYAAFVGRLAEIGANGIEVWNEMNLDREWPNGRIDPALYTEFLEIVYTEVKARNPDTLVISGALAPTGAEGAFGLNAVWNDDRYYQGLANAGAAEFMDCVGAHYNEGIVSPTQTAGDPRDPYPTRYLSLQTARAADPFGGDVPVCYTELGYLSPQGFGSSLPAGFEWASNVTVAQHASWLGTAALLNAQSGNVRLMIIWNLDFTEFQVDPAGGYAIIRPDGACPACDTLGSLR